MKLFQPEVEYVAQQAIVLYNKTGAFGLSKTPAFGTVHEIHEVNGKPMIKEGVPLTKNGLDKALQSLAIEAGTSGLAWFDDETVASGQGTHVWWTPSQKRFMYFEANGLTRAGDAMNPPLVWIEFSGELHVYALKENRKPGPDTELFNAPLFNVYESGLICMGSMQTGKFAQTAAWVDGFYRAAFTHANPSTRKLTTFQGTNNALWAHQMDNPDKEFPINKLIPFGATLRQAVTTIQSKK